MMEMGTVHNQVQAIWLVHILCVPCPTNLPQELREAGFSLQELRDAGFPAEELTGMGCSIKAGCVGDKV